MNLEEIRILLMPYVELFGVIIMSGAGSAIATEFMKGKWFPIPVEKHKRISAIVVSIVSTLMVVFSTDINLIIDTPLDWALAGFGILAVSAITYNNLIKGLNIPTQKK